MKPNRFARFAAPAAFLAAVTIGVLLVRSGLEHGQHHPPVTPTTGTTLTSTRTHHHTKQHRVHTYTVQAGDTFDSIARKTGTTVARLEQLNPGVSPTALHVGQKIRVQ